MIGKNKIRIGITLEKKDLGLFGLMTIILSVLILATNPLNISNFPYNITTGAIIGTITFLIGLCSLWFGFKS